MKSFSRLKDMPIALTGLALGIAGISGAWTNLTGNFTISIIGVCISSILVLIIILKYILHPKILIEELSCPVLGSVIPTLDMTLMIISSIIVKYNSFLGRSIWIGAIIIHCIFSISFMKHRMKDFQLEHMVPSWFVPPIGIVVACTTSNEMGFGKLTEILFYFGLILYIIMLPIMLYRILFGDKIANTKLPTFAVMGAPANLCLAGYLSFMDHPDYFFATSLAYLGIFTTFLVYISFVRIFYIPFSPLYASFTFPLGIGATALLKYAHYLSNINNHISQDYIHIWQGIAYIELFIASIIIIYIFIKMKIFLWQKIIKNNN